MAQETMSFQAEVKQLLQLMIHSLYSNKEIFLRELISNASDAADKLRFEAIENSALYENDPNLRIRVSYDKAARTVTIDDNGIGMSRDEAISNLGTIARSGTKEFFGKLSGDQQKDAALIGQFGVGFYSGFIVADKITVETRRAGLPASEGVRWESAGEGDFAVEQIERAARGTTITLHLRADEDELLSSYRLKSIIQKYSDHVALPILMQKEEWDAEKSEMVLKDEDETVNQASALWTRAKNDITEEQYKQFYQHISHDHQDPLTWTHNRVEGRSEYTQLLYVPAHAPFDMWNREHRGGLKLYVKRVFIMDDAEQLLPTYLRFVKGVVDSSDLPLNVSREILQESRDVRAIRDGVTKRSLSMLEELANSDNDAERAKYAGFWTEFGQVLKEGIGEDHANRERSARRPRRGLPQPALRRPRRGRFVVRCAADPADGGDHHPLSREPRRRRQGRCAGERRAVHKSPPSSTSSDSSLNENSDKLVRLTTNFCFQLPKYVFSLVRGSSAPSRCQTANFDSDCGKHSALFEVSHEEPILVDADHSVMCKFEDDSDQNFEMVYED